MTAHYSTDDTKSAQMLELMNNCYEYSTTSKNNPLHKIGFEQIVTGDVNLDKNQFQRIINP